MSLSTELVQPTQLVQPDQVDQWDQTTLQAEVDQFNQAMRSIRFDQLDELTISSLLVQPVLIGSVAHTEAVVQQDPLNHVAQTEISVQPVIMESVAQTEPSIQQEPMKPVAQTEPLVQQSPMKRIDPPPGTVEEWKSLADQGFPYHEVSTFGRVRGIKYKVNLKGKKDENDHAYVCLTTPNYPRRQKAFVELLVAKAFLPNSEGRNSVIHTDNVNSNNYVGSLRWSTNSEQVQVTPPSTRISAPISDKSQQPTRIDPAPNEEEIWKSLEPQGFPNYEVSSFGRVRNIKRKNILDGRTNVEGYRRISMPDQNGKQQEKQASNLVAIAFHGKPEPGKTVDHIDRIRDNDYFRNVRWATPSEQCMNRRKFYSTRRPIDQYAMNGRLIKKWKSMKDIVETLMIPSASIYDVCHHKKPSADGYVWRYCDEVDIFVEEEWRDIPYPEHPDVQASSLGRIKFPNGRITYGQDLNNYKKINLLDRGTKKLKNYRVNRLVAAAFFGRNDDPKIVVNHKDANTMNNRPDNLEYTTIKGNVEHKMKMGRHNYNPTFERKVIQLRLDGTVIAEYKSIAQAAKDLGIHENGIRNVCAKRRPTAGGYRWRYADE
jgi:hypothetical protein